MSERRRRLGDRDTVMGTCWCGWMLIVSTLLLPGQRVLPFAVPSARENRCGALTYVVCLSTSSCSSLTTSNRKERAASISLRGGRIPRTTVHRELELLSRASGAFSKVAASGCSK
jgi:hypothetical protein